MDTPAPDDRSRLADFTAREAQRLNTPETPRFTKPRRAIYEAPEGWRNWQEYTLYGDD
jgi:hypothetical protein